jgi:ferrous-iron efflux pump FieF
MAASKTRLLTIATYASVLTATLLIVAKLIAWLLTGSVSILASLVDSVMDVGASLVNLFAVRYSLMPADAEHRFGHGKAEALAGLGQATFIAGSAVFLILHAIDRLLHPQPLADLGIGLAVMGLAIVATIALLLVQHHVIRHTDSTAIRADALHYASDLATNSATVAALILAQFGWSALDPVFALGIAAYILYSAGRIGTDAVQLLMDRELPEDERARITGMVRDTTGVRGVHGLRTRQSGQTKVIQLHIELPDELPLIEAHRITMRAEKRLREAFADSDIIIHQDPLSLGDERRAEHADPSQGEPLRQS